MKLVKGLLFSAYHSLPFRSIDAAMAAGCDEVEDTSGPPLLAVVDGQVRITFCSTFSWNICLWKTSWKY